MSLLILVYWFIITRWDGCVIEDRKIITRLLGFITLRNIAVEDIILIETNSEIIAKQIMQQRRGNYNYLRITYHNKQKNKDSSYIITPDNDELFKKQIELMQEDETIQTFIKPKSLVENVVVLFFAIITITLSCVYASESFDHPIITLLSFISVFVIHRYVILKTITKRLYADYFKNLEKYAIR